MSDGTNGVRREYLEALEAYIETQGETALSRAYELGRRAMVDGLGVLDMALLQRAAVNALVISAAPGRQAQLVDAAAAFFDELLSPFELSLRGYRTANETLQHVNDTLRLQKKAVEDANRELEAFSYSVSHDLRAPLRAIDGFSQILIEEFTEELNDEGRSYLLYIREASQRMARVIEDLLELARVAQTDIHRTAVDLSAVARRIVEGLQRATPERIVSVTIEEDVTAAADAGLLAIVLENLLGNAWKFTANREDPRVVFGRERLHGVPTYFVRDNGAGFDMTQAARLFRPFQRLHAAREFEGTGIGLATVQRIVHRHGGRVWAEARIAEGAAFFFTLNAE